MQRLIDWVEHAGGKKSVTWEKGEGGVDAVFGWIDGSVLALVSQLDADGAVDNLAAIESDHSLKVLFVFTQSEAYALAEALLVFEDSHQE